jgi:hypothetical protein
MRGKRAKTARRSVKRQIFEVQKQTKVNILENRYHPIKKFAKQGQILVNGKPEMVPFIMCEPIKLDYCFRDSYQKTKKKLKTELKNKPIRHRKKVVINEA